jgi:hypothetical protein
VVSHGSSAAIHRLRETVDVAGVRSESTDVIALDDVDAAELEAEGRAAGFSVGRRRVVSATDDHIGSTVVMLNG